MEFLKGIGHEPTLLYVQPKKEILRNQLKSYIKHILGLIVPKFNIKRQREKILDFEKNFINPKTLPITTHDELVTYKESFDAYIVGSDQVWRPTMYPYIEEAFFGFLNNNTIKIAYAASFGVSDCEFSETQIKKFSKDLKSFDLITVREKSGVSMCRKHFNVRASHVVDPTMLVDLMIFETLVSDDISPCIATYILDRTERKLRLSSDIAESFENDIIHLYPDVRSNRLSERQFRSVPQWLSVIKSSTFVVTDSFHGCVFAILFNKSFVVFDNAERGSARILSLLEMFGLEGRLVTDKMSKIELNTLPAIDWVSVNKIVETERSKSRALLVEVLGDA